MLQPDERDLRAALQSEAQRHQPDRLAMLDRISRTREETAPSRFSALFAARPGGFVRPVFAAAGVTAVLVAAFTGIKVASKPGKPPAQVAAPATSATPSPTSTSPSPSHSSGHPATSEPPTGHASSHHSVTSTAPALSTSKPSPSSSASAVVVRDGYLSASAALDAGSISTWSQSDVTLTTNETITALVVEITIARTDGVAKTGHWASIPDNMVVSEVDTSTGDLLYRFTLGSGFTLAPGSYTFAAQFNHADGVRVLTGDSYTATATAGTSAKVAGSFTS